MKRFITSYLNKEESPAGLAIFRICYGIVLFLEVLQLYHFRHFIFDAIPYRLPIDISFDYVLLAWLVCLVLLILGFQTKAMTVVNYVMTLMTFSTFHQFEYHADYAYTGLNLLLMFTPLNTVFSLDSFLSRQSGKKPEEKKVYRFHYDLIIYLGVAIVYFDSIFFKLQSPMWTAGLGVWLPASLPQNRFSSAFSFLLDYKWLMLFLGYLTIILETVFIFLMWIPRLRILFFIIGMGLHVGIVIFFPIPFFGMVCSCVYLLLLPPKLWERVFSGISKCLSGNTLLAKIKIYSSLDWIRNSFVVNPIQINRKFNLWICVIIFVASTLIQGAFIASRNNDLMDNVIWKKIVNNSMKLKAFCGPYPRRFAGLIDHDVFLDFHFKDYKQVFSVVHISPRGKKTWLPIINEEGTCGEYLRGRFWVYWTFRVCGPSVRANNVKKGVERLVRHWAHENHVYLHNVQFVIQRKVLDNVTGWEEGFYYKQLEHEWKKCGVVVWNNGLCKIEMEKLE
jgi:uncharacterized membrane protein YphA (DoxX/SURF4 family)